MPYDPERDLIAEARKFATEVSIGRRMVSIVTRLADALEKRLNAEVEVEP